MSLRIILFTLVGSIIYLNSVRTLYYVFSNVTIDLNLKIYGLLCLLVYFSKVLFL